MNIPDINSDLTEDTMPSDEHLIELLDQAYRGNILCRKALVDIERIKPYSSYKPETREYAKYSLIKRLRNGEPRPLNVYAQNDSLIISDDYDSFSIYKEIGEKQILCMAFNTLSLHLS